MTQRRMTDGKIVSPFDMEAAQEEENLPNHWSVQKYYITFWRQRQVNPDKTKTDGEEAKNRERSSRLVLVWKEDTCRKRDVKLLGKKII